MAEQQDFNKLFDTWAPEYDQTVQDDRGEYNEVFAGYEQILMEVVQQIPKQALQVLEFGVGTGNLSQRIVEHGFRLVGIEPSAEMRKQAAQKAIDMELREGDFLQINVPEGARFEAIVSTYAFHHLTYTEKKEALRLMSSYLQENGKIIFADTLYEDEQSKAALFEHVRQQSKHNLLTDLETEYYELQADLRQIFEAEGFQIEFKQLNRFVWLFVASR